MSNRTKPSQPHKVGRICCICGKQAGGTSGFKTVLARAGFVPKFDGRADKAHPACVKKFLDAAKQRLTAAKELGI